VAEGPPEVIEVKSSSNILVVLVAVSERLFTNSSQVGVPLKLPVYSMI